MSHRSRTTIFGQSDSTVPNTTVPRSAIPVRPRLDTRTTLSETRRPGLPSSPRDNLSTAATGTSISANHRQIASPRISPNISSSRSTRLPTPSKAFMSTLPNSAQPSLPHSRSAPEDVPLLLDRSKSDEFSTSAQTPSHTAPNQISGLDPDVDTVFGIAMPSQLQIQRDVNLPPQLIPELQALSGHVPKQSRPLPPSSISTVSSPSTRFTESPAPWSASPATTTPLSWSSASPALTQTHALRTPERKSKTVPQPSRPHSRLPKLPLGTRSAPLPKTDDHIEQVTVPLETSARPRRKKSIFTSPPPTPPPRTSSVKHRDRSGNSSVDSTLSRAAPSRPSTAPSSAQRDTQISEQQLLRDRNDTSMTTPAHDRLQQSIKVAPVRRIRSGTLDLAESRHALTSTDRRGFSPQQRQLLDAEFEEVTRHEQLASSSAVASDTEQSVASEKSRRSPSRLGKFSRFRLFGQNVEAEQDSDKNGPKKLQRRGPAAGTGHEGYGKHTRRGRKQSAEASPSQSESERSQSSNRRIPLFSPARKSSNTSRRTSQSDIDEFAVPRLRPVFMRGGSQNSVVSDPLRSEQTVSSLPPREHLPQQSPPTFAQVHHRPYNQQSQIPRGTDIERSDVDPKSTILPGLAVRRSQRFAPGVEPVRFPAPIRVGDVSFPTPLSSYDTTVSSTQPSSALLSTSSGDVHRIDPSLLKDKKARRRWWNPFKARPSARTTTEQDSSRRLGAGMAVAVEVGPTPRTIPYYAVLESETEIAPAENVGQVLAEANKPSPPSPSVDMDKNLSHTMGDEYVPAAPPRQEIAAPSQIEGTATSPSQHSSQFRQPRLAQIGRIPKVITRTERRHRPSRQSFSQPFSKFGSDETSHSQADWFDNIADEPPLLQIHTDVLPSRSFREAENLSAKPASAPARTCPQHLFPTEAAMAELVPVSSLPASEGSTSSSSAGLISIMGPPIVSNSYDQGRQLHMPMMNRLPAPEDEDVWNEYDDILDQVMSPSRSPGGVSPELTTKRPIRQVISTSRGSPLMEYSSLRPVSRERMPVPEPRQGVMNLPTLGIESPPVMLPSPTLTSERSAGEEIRLRRSRIISALHSSYDPTSPFSMREFLKDYSEVQESAGVSQRLSTSTAARSTLMAVARLDQPRHDNHQDNAIMLDVAKRTKDPIKQSELHYASLEVSRWLSFGRVLFSPGQDEIFTLPDRHVLVIDGLGNEDWSIYCAVTYEAATAVVHDLKETSHYKKPPSPQELEHLPRNLRRAEIASFAERFPFHSAFFSVIVLRFPPAMSEAKMKNIVTECRRILVPGGHIEVMLLELDFVNMGVQTRRAVRELKMRMATKSPDVNLKPTIDHFQSILGGRGFTGLSRCLVGVPVVGKTPGSTDSSTSSVSNSSPARRPNDPANTNSPSAHHGRNFSLSDLVTDSSERADAQIGRMVSKTARNWWQHCYEAAVLPNGDVSRSVFAEKRVLQECKMRASSFKLLIAYAQRPVFEAQTRPRRTSLSEPSMTSLATSGLRRTRGPG